MNNVKIYGADTGTYGTDRDAQERFWRNVFGGMASARFHRPPSGLGLGELAQANLKSMRMLTDRMNIFTSEPRNDLIVDRRDNFAYMTCEPGKQYAIFLPFGRSIPLDQTNETGEYTAYYLNIQASAWEKEETLVGGEIVQVSVNDRSLGRC